MKNIALTLLGAAFLTASCNNAEKETPTDVSTEPEMVVSVEHPSWSKSASIYEVNIRQHTAEGTIAEFTKDIDRLADMGITILWIMPIQPIGVEGRKDPDSTGAAMGSYYSISDYTAIAPEYGDMDDFKAMVDTAHSRGMKVILDWVANHTAFDHHWVTEHLDYYTLTDEGVPSVAQNQDGSLTDWTDVADLNYDNEELHQAMTDEMLWWIDQADIDGFRCDVAGYVPIEFWRFSTAQIREKKSDAFMLAEWDEPYLHEVFDMTYGWDFHHRTNEVAKGEQSALSFDEYRDSVLTPKYPAEAMKMLFTTNHDENSWNGTVYERYGDAHEVFFVLCATYTNGMPLIYSGQEAGLNHRLRFFYKDTVDWTVNPMLQDFYATSIQMKHDNPALWNGQWGGEQMKISTTSDSTVYAFYREVEGNTVAVFLNLSGEQASFDYNGMPAGTYDEVYSGSILEMKEEDSMELAPWGYMVFTK